MELSKLKSIIESLLFISGDPVEISKIAKVTAAPKPEVENALMILQVEYSSSERGLAIIRKDEKVQIATNPANASFVSQFVKSETQDNLSRAALEALSIISYRSPISRAEIESIRGVNCSFTLRSLLMRGLIERIENPRDNRGYLYEVSFEFLKKLGVESVEKLPDFEKLSKDERINSIIAVS